MTGVLAGDGLEEAANDREPGGAQRKGVSDGWHQYRPDGRQDGSGHRRDRQGHRRGLTAMGARVGITGRDPGRTWAAAGDVATASGNPAVDPFAVDVSSQAKVRRLAGEVLAAYPRLDVLVNNAGGCWATRRVTAEGLEHTFAVNHLAPFLLTRLLLDRLKTCRASAATPGSGPTASRNWLPSCSPMS